MENIKYRNNSYSDLRIPSTLQQMRANCPREDAKLRWTLKHKNYLRCVFPVVESNESVYELPGRLESLMEYVETLRRRNILPVMKHGPTNYHYIPTEYRKLWRSMVRFIVYIHSKGLCTLGFSVDEIAVLDGELKFYKIDFKKSKERELRLNDRSSIVAIIRQIMDPSLHHLGLKLEKLPYMARFFEILQDGDRDGRILLDHVAILSFEEILNFVVESYEKSKMLSSDDYLHIMANVVEPHRPLSDIALHDHRVWRDHVGKFVKDSSKGELLLFKNARVFRCARHAAAHLRFGQYGRVDNDLYLGIVIMSCFGGVIANVQEAMDKVKIKEAKAIRKEYKDKTYLSLLNYTNEDEKYAYVCENPQLEDDENTPEVEGSGTVDNV